MPTLRAIVLIATATLGVHGSWPLPTDKPAGTITWVQVDDGMCADGTPAYFGYVEPAVNIYPDKFFVMLVGGSICWNREMCQDEWDRAWMSFDAFLEEKLGADEATRTSLKSGASMALSDFVSDMRPGYIPADSSHPLAGRRGVLVPTCTADFMLGGHTVSYDNGTFQAHHHGGRNIMHTLDSVKTSFPDLKDIAVFGGGGGGVSAAAWMARIARKWLEANVTVLVDSGMLMYPGSNLYKLYRDEIPWGPEKDHGRVPGVPTTDISLWSDSWGMATQLAKFEGRVRIAYLSCELDSVINSDIKRMRKFGEYSGTSEEQLTKMWCFLAALERLAPRGTAYSYIGNCWAHHLTREGLEGDGANVPGTITAKTFVDNFLRERAPNAPEGDSSRSTWWHDSHSVESVPGCVLPITQEPAPSPLEPDTKDVSRCRTPIPTWCAALCTIAVAVLTFRVLDS